MVEASERFLMQRRVSSSAVCSRQLVARMTVAPGGIGVFVCPFAHVRYFKVTLFIGLLVSLFVSCLYWLGVFFQLDLALSGFLGRGAPVSFAAPVAAAAAPDFVGLAPGLALRFSFSWRSISLNASLRCATAAR